MPIMKKKSNKINNKNKSHLPLEQDVDFWKNASPKECAKAVGKLVKNKLNDGGKEKFILCL